MRELSFVAYNLKIATWLYHEDSNTRNMLHYEDMIDYAKLRHFHLTDKAAAVL